METIKKRSIPEAFQVKPKLNLEEIYITVPPKKVSRFRDEVEELKYHLETTDKEYRSDFFENISF
ncbi:hypothetical protein [Ruminococcus sp. 5_1_39BFAA]|uniref:hypothetical protein n=1 Tax=Ruminococcus sp. 5_1_39BFAA TaxID=457412 RepID=UPI00356517F6